MALQPVWYNATKLRDRPTKPNSRTFKLVVRHKERRFGLFLSLWYNNLSRERLNSNYTASITMQQIQLNNANPVDNLTSGWRLGEAASKETIRQGTVRMELHPDYQAAIQKAKDAGFEVRFSGEASIEWTELYDLNQNLIGIRKVLNVATGMRYLDLEHELDHIEQFTTRFGDNVPPLEKKIEFSSRHRRDVDVLAGIMTTKQKIIVEYHNRLVEFLRLYERGVDTEILIDHAEGHDGVDSWRTQYLRNGINNQLSTTGMAFVKNHFPDIPELEKKYKQAIQLIKSENILRHQQ